MSSASDENDFLRRLSLSTIAGILILWDIDKILVDVVVSCKSNS